MKEINELLRRLLRGECLDCVARDSGLYKSQVSTWMRGSDFKTLDSLNKLAKVLNKKISYNGSSENVEERIFNKLILLLDNYSSIHIERMTGVTLPTIYQIKNGMMPKLTTMLQLLNYYDEPIFFELKQRKMYGNVAPHIEL